MKKVKDFLLSLILPRRMYKYHSIRFIFSLLIFILSVFVIFTSVKLSTKRLLQKDYVTVDFTKYNIISENDHFASYQISESESDCLLDVEENNGSKTDTYQKVNKVVLTNDAGQNVELTVVFDEGCDFFNTEAPALSIDRHLFDLQGYLSQTRKENTTYVLYIFTKKSFYYLYDLGKQKNKNGQWVDNQVALYDVYETDADGNQTYYLPKDESELIDNEFGSYDTSFWTIKTSKDEKASFDENIKASTRLRGAYQYYLPKDETEVKVLEDGSYDISLWSKVVEDENATFTYQDQVIKAKKLFIPNLRKILRSGEYLYSNVDYDKFNNGTFNFNQNANIGEVLKVGSDLMLDFDTRFQTSIYAIIAMVINLIVPIVWVFITWLVSRKFVMNKFKEYYAICAITYLDASIIGFILGFFIKFDKLMLILLIFELIYYIFATFRINTNPELLNKKDDNTKGNDDDHFDKPGSKKPDLTFNKISESDAYRVE